MTAKSAAALSVIGALAFGSPVLAQDAVSPLTVLAAKKAHGFSDRTARISSIMGPELTGAAPLRLPAKPAWTRPNRREADASAGLR